MEMIENGRNPRPRVTLMIPDPSGHPMQQQQQQQQHSPYIMSAGTSVPGSQPNWPNPIVEQLYSQRAGDFVFKHFEGLNRFTKSGLSIGEKSVVWMYAKFRTWSRKWFTHCFLFIVVLLYSIGGALIFIALEGPPETQALENVKAGQVALSKLAREMSQDKELLQNSDKWDGEFVEAMGHYQELLYKAFKKGQFDNAGLKKTWTIPNAMFFCGTIYTTIGDIEFYVRMAEVKDD